MPYFNQGEDVYLLWGTGMKKITVLGMLCLIPGFVGLNFAAINEPFLNGTFDSSLNGWSVSPEPNPDTEEEFIIWDEDTQSALLLPYVEEDSSGQPVDTNSVLSQAFLLPEDIVLLSFDLTMKIIGPGPETDIFTASVNDNILYQLTSAQVNTAAFNNDPHIISKLIDGDGILQFATYQVTVTTMISTYTNGNINLVFQLHNENADDCVSSVLIDNVQFLADSTPPEVDIGGALELWPPNHIYHTFTLSDFVSVTDDIDGEIDVDQQGRIISIYSDEPEDVNGNGDGSSVDDIVIIDDSTFKVRAERQGASNGRVYGICFQVEDNNGNSTQTTFYLGTPHDQSGDPPVDDGQSSGYTVEHT